MKAQKNIILDAQDVLLRYTTRSGIIKKFEHVALNGISFSLERGETLGILGRNGCGKSTLLKILAGLLEPTSGKILCQSNVKRALLSLGLGFRGDLSGRDNATLSVMLQGASKREAQKSLKWIHEYSELGTFFDQPVKTYSAGMRARLGFATATYVEVDLLFIDEVLSVGDMHFRQKAIKTLTDRLAGKQTVVFVSHSPEQIKKLCDRAIWLDSGSIKLDGNVDEVTNSYFKYMNELNDV